MRLFARAETARPMRLSRLVGLLLMALVLVVQVWLGDDEDVPWRHDAWDVLHQMAPRDRGDPADAPVVIVAIDEETMLTNGPWPWSRDKLATLVHQLGALGAKVVAFDIILTNPDPQSPVNLAREFRLNGHIEAADRLELVGDSDLFFSNVLRGYRNAEGVLELPGVPSVLPVSGVPDLSEKVAGQGCDFPQPSVLLNERITSLHGGFKAADPPLAMFSDRSKRGRKEAALAAIDFTAAQDFVVRRVKAVQLICKKPLLLLGPEALRVATDGFEANVIPAATGLEIVLDGLTNEQALRFPVERDGSFWIHFGELGSPEEVAQRYIPALSLFSQDFDQTRIRDKIVLLAVVDLGRIDERRSPLGDTIWGIEAHAQMIEQIASGDFLRRPWFMFAVETGVLGLICLLVILLVPRAQPVVSLLLIPLGIVALMFIALGLFKAGLLIDLATPAMGLMLVGGGVMGVTLIERDRARLMSEIALQSERADRSFLQGELEAAARIQTALLPPQRFVQEGRVDLACYIDPARMVGGDFYDHFLVDDRRHLFFLVADVSGKGADASQFMLLSKTLWKSVALRTGAPLERIQLEANSEITRENTATMFVTGLCGLLDLETGLLHYSSAGHDAPFRFAEGRRPEQLEPFSGPPAGLMDGLDYPVGQVQLVPGDRLCIFTDGVTEAMDGAGDLFGMERLEGALGAAPDGLDSAALVEHIVGRVRRFTGEAEQSDDLTLMVISIPS